jgi:hypothetical protein
MNLYFGRLPISTQARNTEECSVSDEEDSGYYSDSVTWSKITADLDSLALLSTYYNNLIDAVSKSGSIFIFTNVIRRTKADTGSRYRLHFEEGVDRPRFSFRAMNDFPGEWFPNIEICTIQIDSGLTLHINYYLIGHGNFRNSHFLKSEELCVLTSAMNYARKAYYALEKTSATIATYNVQAEYTSFIGDFEKFVGQIGANKGKDQLVVYEKQQAVFGRIFLHSVFEALKLFADNTQAAINPNDSGVIYQLNEPKFHGVEGTTPSVERFQVIAHYLYHKGMLVANTAGTKKSFERLPEAKIDLSNNDAVKWFLKKSIKTLKAEIGYYVDSFYDRVSLTIMETNTGDLIVYSTLTLFSFSRLTHRRKQTLKRYVCILKFLGTSPKIT